MKDFQGKVAVITGAASGIGRAMAERFAEEGMKIVLADIEAAALAKAEEEMKNDGADVLAVRTDVSKLDHVQRLADRTLAAYGTVHVVCNNAGVGAGGMAWEITQDDWDWVLGVNLWGVIHGVRVFTPILLNNGSDGHIVNTASMAGLVSMPGLSPYNVSKHGVVTLSEALYHELKMAGSAVGVSVLCPAWVRTNIGDSDRNRPGGPLDPENMPESARQIMELTRAALSGGLDPKSVAQLVFDAVLDGRFYIFPHPDWLDAVRARLDDILHHRSPTLLPPRLG